LMASLIMLSTVASAIPMSNMNLFENTMAMEMSPNMNNDNSHRYANYESYGANYYQQPNYYYSQDRQYDDKQNSYTNDYNNYNKYPTKDKPYECRTGPFEGFFVSSVEFCKHGKFNDRNDNGYDDSDKNLQIFPANKVAELGDRWWQWIASLNNITDPNPFTELGQSGCDVGLQDDGRLLFLVGSTRDENTGDFPVHECKIEKGTSILFPIVNVLCDTLEVGTPFFGANETTQRICANNLVDRFDNLTVNIDGFEVKNPEQYRVDSPAGGFTFTAVLGNPVSIPPGTGTGVADGFWILLKPLKPGEHIISFSGAFDWRDVPGLGDILEFGATYILDVQPSEKSYYPDDYRQQNYQIY
jgi:hypothetical protein